MIKTIYFSVEIPDTWAYQIVSNAAVANLLGFGPTNEIDAVPTEFASFLGKLNKNASGTSLTTLTKQGGVFLSLAQNPNYPIKNAPLATYTEFVLDSFKIRDAFKFENVTIDGENATKFYGNVNGNPENTYIFYITIHNKEPYFFAYFGNNNTVTYQKYLPDIEQIIKSIKWID